MTTLLPPQALASLLAGPAGAPPPGVVPNFVNPPTRQHIDRPLLGLSCGILVVSVFIRLFTRWGLSKQYVIEEFYIIAAWALALVFNALCLACSTYGGTGTHIWDQTAARALEGERLIYIAAATYDVAMVFVKLAILTQFIRLFSPTYRTNRWMFISCWALIVMNIVFYVVHFIVAVAQCTPQDKAWKPYVAGHCMDLIAIYLSSSLFNMIEDFMILLLPLPIIFMLHMSLKKKLMIGGVFATGLIACAASVGRTYYTFRIAHTKDLPWEISTYGIFASYEICLSVLVFCLPVMPSFYHFIRDRIPCLQRGKPGKESKENLFPIAERPQGVGRVAEARRVAGPNISLGLTSVDQYLGRQHYSSNRTPVIDSHNIENSKSGGYSVGSFPMSEESEAKDGESQ